MDANLKKIIEKRVARTIENLQKNNMMAIYAETREEAVKKVSELLNEGDTVAVGGSVSLAESGVIDLLRSGKYKFLDRHQKGLTNEDIEKIYRDSFFADAYITSSNAITENGELYNVDGNSNRVAAICYGPKSVIIVAGYNKIVKDLDEAIDRVKTTAAPANCTRLFCETYCREKGECMSLINDNADMTSGCNSPARICCNYVVSAYQRHKNRIKVIIVGEELGY